VELTPFLPIVIPLYRRIIGATGRVQKAGRRPQPCRAKPRLSIAVRQIAPSRIGPTMESGYLNCLCPLPDSPISQMGNWIYSHTGPARNQGGPARRGLIAPRNARGQATTKLMPPRTTISPALCRFNPVDAGRFFAGITLWGVSNSWVLTPKIRGGKSFDQISGHGVVIHHCNQAAVAPTTTRNRDASLARHWWRPVVLR